VGIARWCHPWTRPAGRLVALLAVAISVVLQGLADPPPPLREYDVLRSLPEGWLEWLSRNDLPDDQGLAGGNRGQGRWIEAGAQRGSCRAVIAAVVAGDLARADRAWRGIEVTFEHQRADGGFSAAERPNGGSSANGAAAVETAYFFLQELGRAILVIRQSPHEAHFRERIRAIEPRLRRACDFIAAGEPTILPKSRKAVNRVFIAAKAFGTCGRVLGDEALVATARRLVAEALKQRDDEGVFLEHGGRDSSYNAVTLLFAQALALHVSLPELDEALKPAARWQVSRVLASGEVDARGNTRTGVGKEPGYDGQPKGINHNEVILALALHGIVHRNPEALDAAGGPPPSPPRRADLLRLRSVQPSGRPRRNPGGCPVPRTSTLRSMAVPRSRASWNPSSGPWSGSGWPMPWIPGRRPPRDRGRPSRCWPGGVGP